jgi:hypothetical protein
MDPILLDNVHCTGREDSLSACRHNPYGSNNCDHSEDVGIRCDGKKGSKTKFINSFIILLVIFHFYIQYRYCNSFTQQYITHTIH